MPVTVLLAATDDKHPGLLNCTDLLMKFGYEYRIIGIGETWQGWRQRMGWYREAAAEYPEDHLIVCMDSYDAVPIRTLTTLEQQFQSFGTELVVSLEEACGANCLPIDDWSVAAFSFLWNQSDLAAGGPLLVEWNGNQIN
jgi:hypothetical protein